MVDLSDFDIPGLQDTLIRCGSVVATDPRGKRMFLVMSNHLTTSERGVLIAYEGEGAFFWDMKERLNKFRLAGAGFSYIVAPTLAALMNAIIGEYRRPMLGLLGARPEASPERAGEDA